MACSGFGSGRVTGPTRWARALAVASQMTLGRTAEATAVEDAEIIARMTAGRRALYLQGRSETGPYQSPLEDGMVHFHEFLRRELL